MENEATFTLASFFPPLQQGAVDMTQLLDLLYLLTTPLFGIMFGLMIWLLNRLVDRYDKGLEELKEIKEIVIVDRERLQGHIDNKEIHTYGRRSEDEPI